MKPRYWNKGKLYLSKKDKTLKGIISNYDNYKLNIIWKESDIYSKYKQEDGLLYISYDMDYQFFV